jgi:hypothetical protein
VQINLWGPLQGEYLLERLLDVSALLGMPASLDPDPGPLDPAPDTWPHAPVAPKATPAAGTPLAQPAAEVERLHTASFEWIGGDPAVDQPRVVLQRHWKRSYRDVELPSGRALDDRSHRIVLRYRPEPLAAAPAAIERHRYRAWFQVVEDVPDLTRAAGFREESYRFRVEGHAFDGASAVPYQVFSTPFRVVPTDDLALADVAREGDVVRGRVVLPTPTGFRLESLTAPAGAPIPVEDARVRAGGIKVRTDADGRFELALPPGATVLSVVDRFGNRADFPAP